MRITQRNLWLVPTRSGLWMLVFWVFLLAGAVNYQSNLGFIMVFLVAAIGLVSIFISFRNLTGRSFSLAPQQWLFAGQPGEIDIQVRSSGTVYQLGLSHKHAQISLAEFNQEQVSLPWTPPVRGRVNAPDMEIGSLFPMGWLHGRTRWRPDDQICVFPTPKPGPKPQIQSGAEWAEGSQGESNLRTYQPGDPLNRVHWKKTQPSQPWPVWSESAQALHDHLDWRSYPQASWEDSLSYLTDQVLNQEASFSLHLPGQTLGPDRGPAFVRQCLQALALQPEQDPR